MRKPAQILLAIAAVLLASPCVAKSITLNGITFSDELGGIVLVKGWGSGSRQDPFVLVEEITEDGPAVLIIRGLTRGFGNLIESHHDTGFTLTKIVHNRTRRAWSIFDMELREFLGDYSPYEDGLSFGQGTSAGRPFRADGYGMSREVAEPYDSVSFTGGRVPPGGTVVITVVVTDMTPRPVFYLLQKRESPVAAAGERQVAQEQR